MTDLSAALAFAQAVARKAGAIQRKNFRKRMRVQVKAARNIVTNVDIACEKLIVNAIKKKYPAHGFLAEEGNAKEAEYVWVIDPLDGTTNYAHGIPSFCVSIALCRNSEPVVGVVYEPMLDQLFYAVKAKGAFLNGKRIHVSTVNKMKDAVVTTGFPYDLRKQNSRLFRAFAKVINNTFALRRLGAAAVDFAYVAAGITDAHYEFWLYPWDVAAGALLITEAGGKVTLPKGGISGVHSGLTVATNGRLHAALRKLTEK